MIKTIMALLLMTGSLSAYSGVKVKDTGETARVFCLIDYKPSDVSYGADGQPIGGEDLKIFNAIKAYWEKKTGATVANKTDENGWSDTYFVALIKGDRIRFSTKDDTGGSLAAGVIMSKWQGTR